MKVIQINYNRGITVLELLIGLAFLLILAAFIAPNLQKDSGRKEMNQVVADFNQHLEMARFAALRLEKEIEIDFRQGLRDRNHSISFIVPDESNPDPVLKEYVLPENIRMFSPQKGLSINSSGQVELAVPIELKSESNSLLNERFLVE